MTKLAEALRLLLALGVIHPETNLMVQLGPIEFSKTVQEILDLIDPQEPATAPEAV